MPRLKKHHYVARHRWLRRLWLEHEARFGVLSPAEQWDVHAYYKPSYDLSESELLKHRRSITSERPTLPARASKVFKVLVDPTADPSRAAMVQTSESGRRIRVTGVVRPEPDLEQLARALLMLAERLTEQEHDDHRRPLAK